MTDWMFALIGAISALLAARLLLSLKTSRPDGSLAHIHPYRRMMPVIMRTKTESIVYFDEWLPSDALEAYVKTHGETLGCTVTHIMLAAIARGLHRHPNLNRFVAGGRLYQRHGAWLSFSMKREKLNAKARLATVKLEVPNTWTLRQLCEAINGKIKVERSDKETYLDKELSLFFKLPHAILWHAFSLIQWCDAHHLLPLSFIKGDAMYTSVFLANLGSLGMEPGYHHLYEWGNCPLFMMAGKISERAVVAPDGSIIAQRGMWLRFSYDERVEDGLSARDALQEMVSALTDPQTAFGAGDLPLR